MSRLLFGVLLVAALVAAGSARSDEPIDIVVCGNPYSTDHPWSWEQIAERHAKLLADNGFHEIRVLLYKRFLESETQNLDASLKGNFKEAFDRYIVKTVEGAAGQEPPDGRRYFIIVKELTPGEGRLVLLFKGQAFEIDFTKCGEDNSKAAQLNELRYLANALVNLSDLEVNPDLLRLQKQIAHVEGLFDIYLFEGFPMYPWEAALNSGLLADDLLANGPPRNQIVVAHPAAAIDFSTEGFNESDPEFAFELNVLGWVRYNEGYSKWWGASLLAASNDGDGLGAGLNLHYNNFSLGVAWYDRTDRGSLFHDDPSILMSWDLYQFVGKKHRRYKDYREKVEAKLEQLESVTISDLVNDSDTD